MKVSAQTAGERYSMNMSMKSLRNMKMSDAREVAEAMREAAAQAAADREYSTPDDDYQLGWSKAAELIAAAIRALPLPDDPDPDGGAV